MVISNNVKSKLKLIEPDEEELELPEIQFSSIITLPSSDFQKLYEISPISQSD